MLSHDFLYEQSVGLIAVALFTLLLVVSEIGFRRGRAVGSPARFQLRTRRIALRNSAAFSGRGVQCDRHHLPALANATRAAPNRGCKITSGVHRLPTGIFSSR